MFQTLCTFNQVSPRFLGFVFGLGMKIRSSDEDYIACYYHYSAGERTAQVASSNTGSQDGHQSFGKRSKSDSYGKYFLNLSLEMSLSPSHANGTLDTTG